MSDCIMADIDQDGNFNGFSIRHDMAKILYWRENGDVTMINKIIKTSNYLNRLLLEDEEDYLLGKKKAAKETADFGQSCDLYEPKIITKTVEKEVEKESETKEEEEINQDMVDFKDVIKNHIVTLNQRMNPGETAYYNIVFAEKTLEEMVSYPMDFIYKNVPDGGFEDEDDRPIEKLSFVEYMKYLFDFLVEKMNTHLTRDQK